MFDLLCADMDPSPSVNALCEPMGLNKIQGTDAENLVTRIGPCLNYFMATSYLTPINPGDNGAGGGGDGGDSGQDKYKFTSVISRNSTQALVKKNFLKF